MVSRRRFNSSRFIHPSLYCSFHWALRRELEINSTISWNANDVELEKTSSSLYGRPLLATQEPGTYLSRKSCSTVVFQSPANRRDWISPHIRDFANDSQENWESILEVSMMLSGVTRAIDHCPLPASDSRRAFSRLASSAVGNQCLSRVTRLCNKYSMQGFPRVRYSSWGMGIGMEFTATTNSFLSNLIATPLLVSDQRSSVLGW